MTTSAAAARDLITGLNQAWPAGDLATISTSYHPDAVLLPPDLGPVIRGREAIVDTYAEFNNAAVLRHFDITDTQVFDFESSHAVHLKFTLAYEFDGAALEDQGLDIYITSPYANGLVVVWRQQVVLASRELTD